MNPQEYVDFVYRTDVPTSYVLNRQLPTGGYVTKTTDTGEHMAVIAAATDAKMEPGGGLYHRITTLPAGWTPPQDKPHARGMAKESHLSPGVFFDADVNTGEHKDGEKPDDWAHFSQALRAAGVPEETILVSSGGGFYPGWLHESCVDLTADGMLGRYQVMQKGLHGLVNAWSVHLNMGKLDSTFDLARVIRMPGSHNRKAKYVSEAAPDGALVHVIHADGPRYSLEELEALLIGAAYPPGHGAPKVASPRVQPADPDDVFENAEAFAYSGTWTPDRAEAEIVQLLARVTASGDSTGSGINTEAGGCMRRIARFVPAFLTLEEATERCLAALQANPRLEAAMADPNRASKWRPITLVAEALDRGVEQDEPFATSSSSDLLVGSEAEATEWLQEHIGAGRLSGMFNRGGQVVHTPAVGEDGYVAPKTEDASAGPMQVQPMNKDTVAAHVTFLYRCYKVAKDKETEEMVEKRVLFPTKAAGYCLAAPAHLRNLRVLRGVTHTPIVRRDGSILDQPGYDTESGLVYAPAPGLVVDPVPALPSAADVAEALAYLRGLVGDFPFCTVDDEANWLGMMLTPLLRELVDSDRKMFVINAHQAGSGKTLLAQVAEETHGAVFRSGLPEDEAEMRKWALSTLSTTTAPVIIGDNVGGTLRSHFLAGLLTTRSLSDRVLGVSDNVTVAQDRMFVVTGNNVQIGNDISRRIVTVAIDPGMERPEERTGFAIEDLRGYTRRNRGSTLRALLVLVRHWVVLGQPTFARDQSDNFVKWETAVDGIIRAAGHPGAFNSRATKTEVKDVDREDFGDFLAKVYEVFGGEEWTMKQFMLKCQQEDSLMDGEKAFLPDDMPTSRLAEALKMNRLSGKSVGKLLSYKTKQYHGGYALLAGEKGRDGIPWRVVKA
jgi:hypothetical protein